MSGSLVLAKDCENVPDAPVGTFVVNYQQKSNDAGGSLNSLLEQDPSAVIASVGCTLKWYDSEMNQLSGEPTPDYMGLLNEGQLNYYVSQVNDNGCESEKKLVKVIFSSIPCPITKNMEFCEGSSMIDNLDLSYYVKIQPAAGKSELDYSIIWYAEKPINPTASTYTVPPTLPTDVYLDEQSEIDFVYYVAQQELSTGYISDPTTLVVTFYARPRIESSTPNPICKGEQIDLKKIFKISNYISSKFYEAEYIDSESNLISSIVDESGIYRTRAFYSLNTGEYCVSNWENIEIVVKEGSISGSIAFNNEKVETTSNAINYPMNSDTKLIVVDASEIDHDVDSDFDWYIGEDLVASGPTLEVNAPNNYILRYSNNCLIELQINITNPTKNELVYDDNFSVYPTIVASELHVEGVDDYEKYSIISASGVVLKEEYLNPNGIINVSGIPNGFYILRVAGRGVSFVKE